MKQSYAKVRRTGCHPCPLQCVLSGFTNPTNKLKSHRTKLRVQHPQVQQVGMKLLVQWQSFLWPACWGELGFQTKPTHWHKLEYVKRGQKTFLSLRIFQGFQTTVPRTRNKNKYIVFYHTKFETLSFTTQRAANSPI